MADALSDVVVLSPHPDDAAFSLGGTIARWRRLDVRVRIVTVFAGIPNAAHLSSFAQRLHQWWDIDTPARRRDEDFAAAASLGVEVIHCNFLDAIYREYSGEFGYPTHGSLYGALRQEDRELANAVARQLSTTIEGTVRGDMQIHAPSGFGGHVDHRITRHVAGILAKRLNVTARYYVELPYGIQSPDSGWKRTHFSVKDLERKLLAAACYRSQTAGTRPSLLAQLNQFALRRGGRPSEDYMSARHGVDAGL